MSNDRKTIAKSETGIRLVEIDQEHKETFRTLFNLYHHDFALIDHNIIPSMQENGYYEFEAIEEYFAEEVRQKLLLFLIYYQQQLAGFIILSRPPYTKEGSDYCLQEFFIVGNLRRSGVASLALHVIFDRFPGRYNLLIVEKNVGAKAFWRKLINRFGRDVICEEKKDTIYQFTV